MERFLTCIICPRGCSLKIELDADGRPTHIEGNACPRGEDYAVTECTAPTRTVTTTAKCEGGYVIPVKTSCPVPKGKMREVMLEINRATVPEGAKIGDVVIRGVAGCDADVIVTGKRP